MRSTTTKTPLRVSTLGTAGPFIWVPVANIEDLRRLLDLHKVRYEVGELVFSLNGEPEVGLVNLGTDTDASEVQKILDAGL